MRQRRLSLLASIGRAHVVGSYTALAACVVAAWCAPGFEHPGYFNLLAAPVSHPVIGLAVIAERGPHHAAGLAVFYLGYLVPAVTTVCLRYWRAPRDVPVGVCRKCGYDLRATPARCPECGIDADRDTAAAA